MAQFVLLLPLILTSTRGRSRYNILRYSVEFKSFVKDIEWYVILISILLCYAVGLPTLARFANYQSFSILCQKKYNQVSEINICLDWERQIDTKNSYCLKITSSSIELNQSMGCSFFANKMQNARTHGMTFIYYV